MHRARGMTSGAPGGSGGKPAVQTMAQKAKRKISLPWFKHSSVQAPHPALSRQHTIDTPSSFHARLLRLQPSISQVHAGGYRAARRMALTPRPGFFQIFKVSFCPHPAPLLRTRKFVFWQRSRKIRGPKRKFNLSRMF